MKTLFVFLVLFLFPITGWNSESVAGWVEEARIGSVTLVAKLDTGATISSLHCGCVLFQREGATWARIHLDDTHTVERPVIRYVHIKQHARPAQMRAVVKLEICLGKQKAEVELSLADRTRFNYPLLLGRNFIAGRFLVKSDSKHLHVLACSE